MQAAGHSADPPRHDEAPPAAVVCRLADTGEIVDLAEELPSGTVLFTGSRSPERTSSLAETTDLPAGATIAHLLNLATARWPGVDLVLILPGVQPLGEWFRALRDAVDGDEIAAMASSLSDAIKPVDAVGLELPGIATGLAKHPGGSANPAATAAAVARTSRRLRPRLDVPLPSCVYVRSAALELLGRFDEQFTSSHAALADFAIRARERGLANVLADDALTPAPAVELASEDAQRLRERHPQAMERSERSVPIPVERSVTLAAVATEPLSVTIDARALGPGVGGTQVYTLGLIESLAAHGDVTLRVLVAPGIAPSTEQRLRSLPRVELLTYEQALELPEPSHVVHRPQQVFSADDLLLIRPLGRRLVITHQDLIAYHNPSYFPSNELWQRYVRTTRSALGAADHVVFFSRHAQRDAAREDLTEHTRCSVVHIGVDPTAAPEPSGVAPSAAPQLEATPFLLCIGADYRHKNRPFALTLLDELRRHHGWPGMLVFAGPHMEHGSSAAEEAVIRAELSLDRELVQDLGPVSESDRLWLMHHAAAVVYPSVHEGFGLLPFEAAAFGLPCLFAALTSLAELLDERLASIDPWSSARSARRAARLLREGPERDDHLAGLMEAARSLPWTDCATGMVEVYRTATAAPYRASAEGPWQALEREREIVLLDAGVRELSSKIEALNEAIGPDGLALVGPDRLLSPPDQRALLALATRPALRRVVMGLLRGTFMATRRVRRAAGSPETPAPAPKPGDGPR